MMTQGVLDWELAVQIDPDGLLSPPWRSMAESDSKVVVVEVCTMTKRCLIGHIKIEKGFLDASSDSS
eukprot:scaffold2294_cov106-Cylindrotheca_fusiformis.AAC.7